MATYSTSINRVFTRKTLNDLMTTGYSDIYDHVIRRYIVDAEGKTNGEIFSEIYSKLGELNRNEYYYTNTLLNKLLVGIHSVNTTTALSQIRIADHIADFVMINGEGYVYEIKSDLDNLERISAQLNDYYKAFSRVSVLVSEQKRRRVEDILKRLGDMGNAVGIFVLSEKDTIFNRSTCKEPQLYERNLDHYSLFTIMRKAEYESIIHSFFGDLPIVAPAFYFKECYELFSQIPIIEAQKRVHGELKKRNRITREVFEEIPMELKSLVYFAALQKKLPEIRNFLNKSYRRDCNVLSVS